MKRTACQCFSWWMIAAAANLPVPVCDGDNLGSNCRQPIASAVCVHEDCGAIDVDFVLLSCNAPDDPDDGPLDHDPKNGGFALGLFPAYLRSKSACHVVFDASAALSAHLSVPGVPLDALCCAFHPLPADACFSPGVTRAISVLRC